MDIQDDHVPLRRPHFNLRGEGLFFMISRRAHVVLVPLELEVWRSIDGQVAVGQLRNRFPEINEVLARFWELSIIELAPARVPENRRRVLIIEPHMDDAILSVGGLMWQRRNHCEFSVVSVTGVSNFTSYCRIDREFFDIEQITDIRRRESDLAMRVLGGSHTVLEKLDAPLRFQGGRWSLDWYRKNRRAIAAYVNHSTTEAEVQEWTEAVAPVLAGTDAEEIWIPMGIGTSADHETTRNACLRALQELPELLKQKQIFLYHEVPYARNFPEHTRHLLRVLKSAGARFERVDHEIKDALLMKHRLVSIYASQFKMSYMGPRLEETARLLGNRRGAFGEPLLKLTKFPDRRCENELFSGRQQVDDLAVRLRPWLKRHRESKRITMLSPTGAGRWREDMGTLLQFFPQAVFEVHMTADAVAETERFQSPRIFIHPVRGTVGSWIRRLLAVFLSGRRPLIVVTGNPLRRVARIVRTIFLFSSPITTTSIDHLALGLHLVRPANGGTTASPVRA